jgi:hypothetical protein
MSEHTPARQGVRAASTVDEFCVDHRISRSKLYQLWNEGVGPRVIKLGHKMLITQEAAADWRAAREAATVQPSPKQTAA